jgi:hypothetical protein
MSHRADERRGYADRLRHRRPRPQCSVSACLLLRPDHRGNADGLGYAADLDLPRVGSARGRPDRGTRTWRRDPRLGRRACRGRRGPDQQSPVEWTIRPPWRATSARSIPSCQRSRRSHAWSPSASASRVDPTMSVNRKAVRTCARPARRSSSSRNSVSTAVRSDFGRVRRGGQPADPPRRPRLRARACNARQC